MGNKVSKFKHLSYPNSRKVSHPLTDSLSDISDKEQSYLDKLYGMEKK